MTQEQETTTPIDPQALKRAWNDRDGKKPSWHVHLVVAAKTDLGRVRENNEDKFDFLEPWNPSVLARKGRVYAVADGMGGHSAGQVAAELALNGFIGAYYDDESSDVEPSMARAVRAANAFIVDSARSNAGRQGMGATLTAVVVKECEIFVAQVGDSRCYLLRDGQLRQLTEDHSWVAEQVRSGAMSLEQAEQSPFRNVITRSMGGAPEVEPDLSAYSLDRGDRFLLCSDGLSGMVPASEIALILAAESPSVAAWELVNRANHWGGRDNITAMVLHVDEIVPWSVEEAPEEHSTQPVDDGRYVTEVLSSTDLARAHGEVPAPPNSVPPAEPRADKPKSLLGSILRRP